MKNPFYNKLNEKRYNKLADLSSEGQLDDPHEAYFDAAINFAWEELKPLIEAVKKLELLSKRNISAIEFMCEVADKDLEIETYWNEED